MRRTRIRREQNHRQNRSLLELVAQFANKYTHDGQNVHDAIKTFLDSFDEKFKRKYEQVRRSPAELVPDAFDDAVWVNSDGIYSPHDEPKYDSNYHFSFHANLYY